MMDSSEKSDHGQHSANHKSRLKWLITFFSWGLFVLVAVFVYLRGKNLLADQRIDWGELHVTWLVISMGVYSLSLFPQAWYFRRLIESARYHPGMLNSFRAHITGHLGKYVPGKTMVVLMRSAMMKKEGVPFLTTVWAAMLETVVFMAVGGLLGAISFPYVLNSIEPEKWQAWFGPEMSEYLMLMLPYRGIAACGFILLAFGLVPVLTPILDKLAGKLSQKKSETMQDEGLVSKEENSSQARHISQLDVWRGIGWESLSWVLQCLSLVVVMHAWGIGADTFGDMINWGSIVVVTTVIGFLAFFTPGGLGVKDALLMELLILCSPVTKSQAVAIAISHRLISLSGEILVSAILGIISVTAAADNKINKNGKPELNS